MSPFEIDHVIHKPEQNHHADGKQAGIVLHQSLIGELKRYLLLNTNQQEYDRYNYSKCLRPIKILIRDDVTYTGFLSFWMPALLRSLPNRPFFSRLSLNASIILSLKR